MWSSSGVRAGLSGFMVAEGIFVPVQDRDGWEEKRSVAW
jgi:hypothetical protein